MRLRSGRYLLCFAILWMLESSQCYAPGISIRNHNYPLLESRISSILTLQNEIKEKNAPNDSSFLKKQISNLLLPFICCNVIFFVWLTPTQPSWSVETPLLTQQTTDSLPPPTTITPSLSFKEKELQRWKKGLLQINDLLSHWEEKTTYCNYGEFQNELLTKENKEQLIEKVKEAKGLLDFDKSKTMRIKCRKDPEMVRAYFGWKPDNNPTLYNVELNMLKKEMINSFDDSDRLQEYIEAVELFTSAKADLNTLSYEAKTDFASQQTLSPEEMKERNEDGISRKRKKDFLAQSRDSAEKVRNALEKIIEIVQSTDDHDP